MANPATGPKSNPLINSVNDNPSQLNVKDVQKSQDNSRFEKAINWIRIHVFGQKQKYTMILHVTDTAKLPNNGNVSKESLGKDVHIGEEDAERLRKDLEAGENVKIKYEYENAPAQHDAYDVDSDFELAIAMSRSLVTYNRELAIKESNDEFGLLRDIVDSIDVTLNPELADMDIASRVLVLQLEAQNLIKQDNFEDAKKLLAKATYLVKFFQEIVADKLITDYTKKYDLLIEKLIPYSDPPIFDNTLQKIINHINEGDYSNAEKLFQETENDVNSYIDELVDDVLDVVENELGVHDADDSDLDISDLVPTPENG
jgi:hypothetical protein